MSDALYLGMMGGVNCYSAKDKKRMKRNKLLAKIGKTIVYAGAILMTAYGADNFIANAGIASVVCAAMECLR